MIQQFLAHAGEHHETVTEAAQHAAGEVQISAPTIFWLSLVLVPLILVLIMTVLKMKLTTKLLVVSAFLIVFSIVSYQEPGLYSAVALSVGFGIVLLQSIVGLSSREEQ